MSAPVVTLDGPSGSGKGTLSRALAQELGWHLLDSGALYRLVALALVRAGLDPGAVFDAQAHAAAAGLDVEFGVAQQSAEAQVLLGGEDVTRAIRAEAIGNQASQVAARPPVRQALLERQRAMCCPPGLIADGRDMGTVVFPRAEVKLFITATARERARRRHAQLSSGNGNANIDRIYSEILERDERDAARTLSPLKPAPDAHIVDTTALDVGQTLARIRTFLIHAGVQ